MTVHRWFANTACPGDYLYGQHADIAKKVNEKLSPNTKSVLYRVRKTWSDIKSQLGAFTNLNNAKVLADKNADYEVYDEAGNIVYEPAKMVVKTIAKGSVVKVKKGAKSYEGVKVASFVYNGLYTVDELKGKRAVLDRKGICTAFNVDDLIVQ